MQMQSTLFCFATDILDEGCERVIRTARRRAGVDAISVAVKYHAARDIFPHNPRKVVAAVKPALYLQELREGRRLEDDWQYRGDLSESDVLRSVARVARSYGMDVDAWVVLLHDDGLVGGNSARFCCENCFGDVFEGILCPSNPDVVEWCARFIETLCTYPIRTIHVESGHFHGIAHGYHHERLLEEFSPVCILGLGLCFCGSCLSRARSIGIDGEAVRRKTQETVQRMLREGPTDLPVSEDSLGRLVCGPDGEGYMAMREESVASLLERLGAICRASGRKLNVIDQRFGIRSGSRGEASEQVSLETGLSVRAFVGADSGCEVTAYAEESKVIKKGLELYQNELQGAVRLSVILRPGPPDCRTRGALRDKIEVVREYSNEVGFYCYGLYRLERLDWIRFALEES